jgi:hypothetical protein
MHMGSTSCNVICTSAVQHIDADVKHHGQMQIYTVDMVSH